MRKTIAIAIAILLCMSFAVMPVFADSISLSGGGIRPPTQEEIAYAEANPKIIDPEQLEADRLAALNNRTSYTSVPITLYGQEHRVSCGPACVRMVLKTLTGSAPSESAVRNGTDYNSNTGATMASLTAYINNYQDIYTFATSYPSTLEQMCNSIFYGLYYQETPQIIGVLATADYGFNFSAGMEDLQRHGVCSYKISNDYEIVYVADPWIGINPDNAGTFSVNTGQLFTAYRLADAGMSW